MYSKSISTDIISRFAELTVIFNGIALPSGNSNISVLLHSSSCWLIWFGYFTSSLCDSISWFAWWFGFARFSGWLISSCCFTASLRERALAVVVRVSSSALSEACCFGFLSPSSTSDLPSLSITIAFLSVSWFSSATAAKFLHYLFLVLYFSAFLHFLLYTFVCIYYRDIRV